MPTLPEKPTLEDFQTCVDALAYFDLETAFRNKEKVSTKRIWK